MKKYLCAAIAAFALLSADAVLAAARAPTLIVIPARYRIVSLAFDVVGLTQSALVSYQVVTNRPDSVLHIWKDGRWVELPASQYRAGRFLGVAPKSVVFVAEKQDMPASLIEPLTRWSNVRRVNSLEVASIVTEMNEAFSFKQEDLKWLAERHGLTLVDENAERRRYGRYGRYGEREAPRPPERVEKPEPASKREPVKTPEPVITLPPPTPPEVKPEAGVIKPEPPPPPVPVIPPLPAVPPAAKGAPAVEKEKKQQTASGAAPKPRPLFNWPLSRKAPKSSSLPDQGPVIDAPPADPTAK